MLGTDGSPLVMQPAYQQVVLKPGSASSYTQQAAAQPQVQGPQQPAGLGPQQQQQSASGQVVMPQYFGLPQQVYMMPPSGRPPYAQQQQTVSLSSYPTLQQIYALRREFKSLAFRKF